jgi:hypothetical protein
MTLYAFIFLPASNPLSSLLTRMFFTDWASIMPTAGSSFYHTLLTMLEVFAELLLLVAIK